MVLRIRAHPFGQHPSSVLLCHNHEFGYPEHHGWKLIPELHHYLAERGYRYTVMGRWEENGADEPGSGYYIHADVNGLNDDDLIFISMKWLNDFSLLENVR